MTEEVSIVKDTDLMEGELSELESILPQQFYGARRGTSELKPFRRLMVAMMTQAVRCFQNKCEASTPAARKEFAEVRSWIFSNTENGVFCFRGVCDALELDPEGLRKSLVKWHQKEVAGWRRRSIQNRALSAKPIAAQRRRFAAAAVDLR